MAVDTVCSSSLTAVHLAAESIRRGECESAVAGGVNLLRFIVKNIVFRISEYRIAGAVFYESTPGHAAGSDRDENRRNPCSQTGAV
ncbi:hypothetical protein C3438_18650 [Bacillus velezensis]|nr:hypothetical protein C3438_18650 [Bacillus velezensis]QAV92420.1 hypothetical protein ES966_09525 [Bacillus velezensis]QAW24845.1 hypothetical protein ETA12_09525 [Bacillus velezensis]QAW50020.1 hypothetical protein ETK69_09895 [Bacillus velezensis]